MEGIATLFISFIPVRFSNYYPLISGGISGQTRRSQVGKAGLPPLPSLALSCRRPGASSPSSLANVSGFSCLPPARTARARRIPNLFQIWLPWALTHF